MRHSKTIGLALLLAAVIASCSNDSSNNPPSCSVGNPSDQRILIGKEILSEAVDLEGVILFPIFDLVQSIFDDPDYPTALAKTTVSLPMRRAVVEGEYDHDYDSSSQYWVFNYELESGADVRDSLRFYHGNTVVQWPDAEDLDKIERGIRVTSDMDTLTQTSVITGSFALAGVITLNADGFYIHSYQTDIETPSYSCDVRMQAMSTIDDVVIDLAIIENDGCPLSGDLHYDGVWDYTCEDPNETLPDIDRSEEWQLTQTFTGNQMIEVEFRLDDTCWGLTEDCD